MAANLRSYRPDDAAAMLALSRRVQTREEEQVGTPLWSSMEELQAELEGLDRPPEETIRVIEDDGRPAGFGGIEVEDEVVLFGPMVSPRSRGRKVGRTLLAASLELAREEGVGHLVASVGVRNVGGRLMLQRNGFESREGPVAVYRLIPGAHHPLSEPHAGVTTRIARRDDVEQVLGLCHECFARSPLSDEAWSRALERGQVRVADEHGVPIALVRINPVRRRVFHGVTAAARERGVGGFVLSEALQQYWEEHVGEVLHLAAPVENVAASRLYRRQGFAPWLVLQPFELEL